MTTMLKTLQGKKTIICGLAIAIAAVVLTVMGMMDVDQSVGMIGIGLAIAGFAEKANRHQAELVTALQAVSRAGADYRSGNSSAAVKELVSLAAGAIVPAPSSGAVGEDPAR